MLLHMSICYGIVHYIILYYLYTSSIGTHQELHGQTKMCVCDGILFNRNIKLCHFRKMHKAGDHCENSKCQFSHVFSYNVWNLWCKKCIRLKEWLLGT